MSKSGGAQREPQAEDVGLHALVAGGGSRVSLSAALRAREVSPPGDEQLAEAERTVVVRRAHRPGSSPVRS